MATDLCIAEAPAVKETPRTPPVRVRDTARLWLGLAIIMAGNFLVRHEFERWDHRSYASLLGVSLVHAVRAEPWRALLPMDIGGGQTWWATSSLLVLDALDRTLTPRYTFVVLNLLTVFVSFWTSWIALRSRVFTYTFAICMAFGTHLHYSFALAGAMVLYLQIIYLEIILLCFYNVLRGTGKQWAWRAGFAGSLAFFAMGFDTWYNFLLYVCLACALLYWFCRRSGDTQYIPRLRFIVITALAIACVHIPVKLANSQQHFRPGQEDELIVAYRKPVLILEDFTSNVITYTYMSLMNYAPPFLLTSNSQFAFKDEGILEEQHGYHEQYSHLVAMHHHFLWHFSAGIVFAFFAWGLWRSIVGALRDHSTSHLIVALMLLGVLAGAGTHLLIKFRPYLSVPSLTYKCMPGVLATTILLSYGLMKWQERFRSTTKYAVVVVLVWGMIVYGGLTRPARLSFLNSTVGLGSYPDPIRGAKQWSKDLMHGNIANE